MLEKSSEVSHRVWRISTIFRISHFFFFSDNLYSHLLEVQIPSFGSKNQREQGIKKVQGRRKVAAWQWVHVGQYIKQLSPNHLFSSP